MKFRLGEGKTYTLVPFRVRVWLNYQKAPAAAKDVYFELLHILSLPSADAEVWVPQKRLQKVCNLSERSVQRAIAWLEAEGLIQVHHRVGYGSIYELGTPASLMSTDTRAMKAANFCPCDWRARCYRHPTKVSGKK